MATQEPSARNWKDTASTIGFAIVGLVFVLSAVAKLSTIGAFEIQLVKQGIFADRNSAMWPARILSGLELLVGLGLFQPTLRRRLFGSITGAMLIAFSGWLIYLLTSGKAIEDCGCFGDLLKMSPGVALTRNLVLLAILAASWKRIRERHVAWIPIGLCCASIAATALLAPPKHSSPTTTDQRTNTDNSPFAPFTDFSDGKADLTTGSHILAFLSLDCEHCQETAMHLSAAAPTLPPVRIAYLGTPDQVPEFEGMSGSAFPWTIPEPGLFFDFIGEAPPRVYLLQNGNIVKSWDQDQFSIEALQETIGN